jgi:hypothetical protein
MLRLGCTFDLSLPKNMVKNGLDRLEDRKTIFLKPIPLLEK